MATTVVARTADTLTLARVPLAVLLALATSTGRWVPAAVILVCGWITDTLDGILARRVPGTTRLGPWDAIVDGILGLGLIVGLGVGGYVPVTWLILALVLGGLLLTVRSLASGMLLQAMAYGWFLWILAIEEKDALVLVLAAIGLAAVTYGHRIPRVLLPRFFADVARLKGAGQPPDPES